MGLIKDGKVYRTEYEQIVHLTEKHEEQLTINENLSRELANVSVAANEGGYNLVRFSFEKSGTFYRVTGTHLVTRLGGSSGDYFEITSGKPEDIPAYGFYFEGRGAEGCVIRMSFAGDFTENYSTLTIKNVTKGTIDSNLSVALSPFAGTALTDYNANENKKQLFNVIDDLSYGGRTQYASFDLNRDGTYNFVYIGSVRDGKDGASVYSVTNETFDAIHSIMKQHDTVLVCSDVPNISFLPDTVLGDVYEYQDYQTFVKVGNIRGPKGEKGVKGDTGATGATGPQGAAGATGATGPKGEKGEPGQSLRIHDGIKSNPAELPAFSTTVVADAYVVINTSGAVATYDLYYHAIDGTDWSILPNWGGVPGPQGPQGATGATGATGPAGPAGVASPGDITALVEGSEYISVGVNETGDKVRVGLDMTNVSDTPETGSQKLLTSGGAKAALDVKLNANREAVAAVEGLVKPTATPSATELVGINSAKEQVRVNIGDGLSFDENTKTLSASGGGGGVGGALYYHTLMIEDKANNTSALFGLYSSRESVFNLTDLHNYLLNFAAGLCVSGAIIQPTTEKPNRSFNITALMASESEYEYVIVRYITEGNVSESAWPFASTAVLTALVTSI